MRNSLFSHVGKKTKRLLALALIICVSGGANATTVYAEQRIENVQIFGALPERDKGLQLESCLAGLKDFLYISIANGFSTPRNDIKDYWRDFFLAPTHFNDVYGVQLQLNKARYAVIGTYLRCDVARFNQVKDTYYKLDAELYFLRHFIDTASMIGTPSYTDRITSDSIRNTFSNEVVEYILDKSPDGDELKKRALYSGYFDVLVGKYKHKVGQFGQYQVEGSSSDAATVALVEKVKKLGKTIESIQNIGTELKGLGNDIEETAVALKEVVAPEHSTSDSALYDLVSGVASRFDVCVSTDEDRFCASDGIKYLNSKDVIKESPEARQQNLFKTSATNPKSFEQVLFAVEENKRKDLDDIDEAEMLTRYEILYGRVGASGIHAMVNKVDELNNIIKVDTLPQLEKIYACANDIEDRQCK